MKTKLSALLALAFYAVFQPLLAFAQQSQPPSWQMHCPMWSGELGFWWMGPLMFLFFVMAFAAVFFLGRLSARGRSGSGA